ncbi:Hypothetical protein, putative [Bodo saltans]|uniref:Peptidylprolyl isomerase n=1 Tax=Bodo saltans TaxID=75058 RepID=A0A0S4J8C1_BODSA|nr:Hypothetical protein, putative [Bodo saltans]|eukprot:CUG86328.1 Hypothetical protein, putative [Bodo saltans]
MSLEFARRLAAVTQQPLPTTTTAVAAAATTVSQSTTPAATPPLVEQLPSDLVESIPAHIRAAIPVRKLVEQSKYFKIPAWVAIPAVALHLECLREGVRMAPLSLDRYPTYLLGQSPVCDFRLEHTSISRVHAALAYHGEKKCFVVVDLQSTNGVKVNGKRVEAGRPIPLPVDAVLEFGLSARKYVVRKGAASKHGVGLPAEKSLALDKSSSAQLSSTTEVVPVTEEPHQQHAHIPEHAVVAEVSHFVAQQASVVPAPVVPAPLPVVVVARELRHILFKHKDCKNPKSLNPSNKGEVVTRTLSEASALAASIRSLQSVWSEAQFVDATEKFSECSSSKKGGALGVVRPGDFAEDFEMHALQVPVGCVSDPFTTSLGVHLVFCVRLAEGE